jgi:hypothetical protein
MDHQLYLHESLKRKLILEIDTFRRLFNERLFPTFSNIESEADSYTKEYFERISSSCYDESIDPSVLADQALEKGVSLYFELSQVKYSFTAVSISSLYHMWEQQIKRFLFRELRHTCEIELQTFCSNGFRDFQIHLSMFKIDITTFRNFSRLNELRLLSNVIKHGDGKSARELFKLNSSLFNTKPTDRILELGLESTLLDESLKVDQDLFNSYSDTLMSFWEEFPERSFCE